MPVVFGNPQFKYQYGPNGTQAYVQQLDFGQMLREVTQWNPNVDSNVAGRWINNYYRNIIRKRQWYALKLRGSINVPTIMTQGQCTVTNNSNTVQGIGTAWAANGPTAIVGLQFRAGFSYPWATITSVDNLNQRLTIDIPYGGQTQTGGYQVQEVYTTLGANIRYLLWANNQQQGWPIEVNTDVRQINVWDVWRFSLGWTKYFANRAPTPDGQLQIELWPTPFQAQVFPFEAYSQPQDMVLDSDSPASFIDADVIVTRAIADALRFGGPKSPYYDATTAAQKVGEYKEALESMENTDNMLDQQDVTWDYGYEDGNGAYGEGSIFAQSHDV